MLEPLQLPGEFLNIHLIIQPQVIHSLSFIYSLDLFLKGGDVICLLHGELDAYLSNERGSDKIAFSPGVKNALINANSFWEVELQHVSRGGIATWNKMLRFRNLVSGLYLAVVENSKRTGFDLTTTKDALSTSALFLLNPTGPVSVV